MQIKIGPIQYNSKELTHAAPLSLFRILFGIMMFASIVRFWYFEWIEKFYLEPIFFFKYYGFEWVTPLGIWTYTLFIICGLSSLGVALGYKYRFSITLLFLSFTYIELMDKTNYLNHYYFISVLSFIMIFLPAAAYYSVDAWKNKDSAFEYIPRWAIDSIKLILGIVYFYAGLAKLNYDWMISAMPLKIWLPGRYDLPIIGGLLEQEWMAYVFSWGGALYDLTIPFLLLYHRTRGLAFILVVVFHVITRILFPIGMFPYIMIVSTLIFFDPKVHNWILAKLSRLASFEKSKFDNTRTLVYSNSLGYSVRKALLIAFFAVQIILPFRYLMYPGNLFWTEEGFRFSWRVMLMEKAGIANFKMVDGKTGNSFFVDNNDFLTTQQQKMMSTQPDMILEYAHYLGNKFEDEGHRNVEIYVESFVALNGRTSRPFIDPSVDLMSLKDDFSHREWVLDFEE